MRGLVDVVLSNDNESEFYDSNLTKHETTIAVGIEAFESTNFFSSNHSEKVQKLNIPNEEFQKQTNVSELSIPRVDLCDKNSSATSEARDDLNQCNKAVEIPANQDLSRNDLSATDSTFDNTVAKNVPSRIATNLSEKAKKKSWYNVIYPNYKSRAQDFKRLFKEVSSGERLIVDYSCALQREILLQGRLYVSQNYVCFHANIFRWETFITLKWKDVTSITKEKTALVIPNAISICTEKDRYLFATFVSRDKSFLMLFRIWQNTLLNKPMLTKEVWQFVHDCYGEELGLTTDDEDYIDPTNSVANNHNEKDGILLPNPISGNQSEILQTTKTCSKGKDYFTATEMPNRKVDADGGHDQVATAGNSFPNKESLSDDEDEPQNETLRLLDATDTNMQYLDSEERQFSDAVFLTTTTCTSPHEGRQLMHTVLPLSVDTLFKMLFSKSKFMDEFHALRKSSDIVYGDWVEGDDGMRIRHFNITVQINAAIGPKTTRVSEQQQLRKCSKPGELYSIDVNSTNSGIPYADSFSLQTHYCLARTAENHTMFSVYAQIMYKKSIWSVVKAIIEKNTWVGLDDFFGSLLQALQSQENIERSKGKSSRSRRDTSQPKSVEEPALGVSSISYPSEILQNVQHVNEQSPQGTTNHPFISASAPADGKGSKRISVCIIALLLLLILLNVTLVFKLWDLEGSVERVSGSRIGIPNLEQMKKLPGSPHEWIELLRQQEHLHLIELQKLQSVLQTSIQLLQKVSVLCRGVVTHGELLTTRIERLSDEL